MVQLIPLTLEEERSMTLCSSERCNEPCWLCMRETRKTMHGYMCWECQNTRPVWEAHVAAIEKAEGERRERAYKGHCYSCAKTWVEGTWECEPCRKEWEG